MNHEPDWADSDFSPEDPDYKSKSQRKREMLALQDLGASLVALSPALTEQIPLPDRLKTAIEECRKITSNGAKSRQLQFIGKLMRDADVAAIEDALSRVQHHARLQNMQFHRVEHWRDRLLAEGDAALNLLLTEQPELDRQQIRALLRNAKKEAQENKPPASARELFRVLRDSFGTAEDDDARTQES